MSRRRTRLLEVSKPGGNQSSYFKATPFFSPIDESDKQDGGIMLREQDRFLPICNIIKIMKVPVPQNGKIAKDARECIQECVSEFISFISSEAIERSVAENRKTVNGDDLLVAFSNLGFDNYVEPLSIYLQKYREVSPFAKHCFTLIFYPCSRTNRIEISFWTRATPKMKMPDPRTMGSSSL